MPAKHVVELATARKAMNKFAPDLAKEMKTEITLVLKNIQSDAKGLVPSTIVGLKNFNDNGVVAKSRTGKSRAFPKFNANEISKNIKISVGQTKANPNGYRGVYSILQRSAIGAIVEIAGRQNPSGNPRSRSNNPNAGKQFIEAIERQTGGQLYRYGKSRKSQGRIIFRAAEQDQGETKKMILSVIDKTLAKFNSRMGK